MEISYFSFTTPPTFDLYFIQKMGNPDWDCPFILKIMQFFRACTNLCIK